MKAARKRNASDDKLLDVPLDPTRSVRLYLGASGDVRLELADVIENRILFALDLGPADVSKLRAATKALLAVRARMGVTSVEAPALVEAPAPQQPPYGVILAGASESRYPFLIDWGRRGFFIVGDIFAVFRTFGNKEQLKAWGFKSGPPVGGKFPPWATFDLEGVRAFMAKGRGKLAITPHAWVAYQQATSGEGGAGSTLGELQPAPPAYPVIDPATLGLPPPPHGVRIAAEPFSKEMMLLGWDKLGRGYVLIVPDMLSFFNAHASADALKSMRFSTGKSASGQSWLPWATQSAPGALELLSRMHGQLYLTARAWQALAEDTGVGLDPGVTPLLRIERNSSAGFVVKGPEWVVDGFKDTLRACGFEVRYGQVIAASIVPVYTLLRSNVADKFIIADDIMAQAAALASNISGSTVATGENCGTLISPPGKKYLPFQCAGIAYAMQREGTLIADEPGLGKTIQALGFVNNRSDIDSVIVVAPASLLTNWRREASKWLARPFNIYVAEDTEEHVPLWANFVIVNYEKLVDIEYKEIDFGPVERVHEAVTLAPSSGRGSAKTWFGVRNVLNGRIVPDVRFGKVEKAEDAARSFSKYGEPYRGTSMLGTQQAFSYWWEKRGSKLKNRQYEICDASWKPVRPALFPVLDEPGSRQRPNKGDLVHGTPTKRIRPSIILRDLMERQWGLLVVDEVHKIKGSGTEQQKSSMSILGVQTYDKYTKVHGLSKEGLAQRSRNRIYLSGTPMPNRTVEMWPYIHDLAPQVFSKFFDFAFRYCGPERNRYTGGWDFKGSSNTGELYELLRGTMMVRRLKKDVLTELPAKMRQIVMLPSSILDDAGVDISEQADQYEALMEAAEGIRERMSAAIDSGNEAAYAAAAKELLLLPKEKLSIGEISRARRDIAVAKVPYVVEHLENLLESGVEAVVVMAHHHEVQDALFKAFTKKFGKGSTVLHTGGLAPKAKDAAVVAFQGLDLGNGQYQQPDPACRIFIGSILASGVGITLTRSHNLVFAELDWVPGNVSQAEDRVHRIGQTEPVLIQHLIVDGSLDAMLVENIIAKQANITAVLDTARGAKSFEQDTEMRRPDATSEVESADVLGGVRKPRKFADDGDDITPAEWAVQTILQYDRDQRTINPLNGYDLSIVAHVVRHHMEGLSEPKERAAIAVAMKIAGTAHRSLIKTSTPMRGPKNELEEWASRALSILSAADSDLARVQNERGFSRTDSSLGHALEAKSTINALRDDEWQAAIRIAMRYRKTQVGLPPVEEQEPKSNRRVVEALQERRRLPPSSNRRREP